VCVSSLKNPLKNNHVIFYIAVTGVSVGTKLYTYSYYMYHFYNNIIGHKLCVIDVVQIRL